MNHDRRVKNITILSWRLPFTSPSSSYSDALSRSHPDIDLVDLPEIEDPPPLDLYTRVAEAYIYRYIIKALPVLREIISALVSSYHASGSVHVVGLVLDFFSNPLIDVGDDLNIPSYILLTCSAGFLGLMKYLSERHRRVASEFDDRSCHELLSIPGFLSLKNKQLLKEDLVAGIAIAETLSMSCFNKIIFPKEKLPGSGRILVLRP
ncbi:PREDICTED: UDP-glycosyltransferase 71C1-like [Tarenaya hassleriana]|uniref:UDP-glycosyltransferase 71C1-like n=1 Tax=Tarenaya hassleriana TaxID=28532 RepID=UPI00053C1273|nr:PREDICTED: UDP-glycosyltransferase 71C1-like [Tarenaya hassleriana]